MNQDQIKKIQDSLVKLGYMTPAQVATGYGIYGPQTTKAYALFQEDVKKKLTDHPTIAAVTARNGVDAVNYAVTSGDISGLVNVDGKPFSDAAQREAFATANAALEPYYKAQKEYDTQMAESAMKQKQLDYQNYLATAGTQFQSDKTTLDQNAADTGVLFSGGRAQKEAALQNKYNTDLAYKQATVGGDIGDTARSYQYKYGNNAAGGLSQYYNLGAQSYNAGVATGGVSPNGLNSVYNPSASNFQGTAVTEQQANAQKRTAALLANKGNKLVATGYKNQF